MSKLLYSVLIVLVLLMAGCDAKVTVQPPTSTSQDQTEREKYLNIMTTNKLICSMVKDLVKDKHNVSYMLKTKEDQWNFTYTEDSLTNISNKDIFIYNGAGFEPWISKFVDDLKKGKVAIINASRGIGVAKLNVPITYKDTDIKENPNYLVNSDYYKIALSNIKTPIEDMDPKNRDFYESNFSECLKNIDTYNKGIKKVCDNIKSYNFITIGNDLDYFISTVSLKVTEVDSKDTFEQDFDKAYKKFDSSKKTVFLYNDNIELSLYKNIINKYNLTPIHIITYDGDKTIEEIYSNNFNQLFNMQ